MKPACRAPAAVAPIAFYVAPDGRDTWSGTLPAANARKTNGPFATLERAARAVRGLKKKGLLPAPVEVRLRGGLHLLPRPLTLTPEDSGNPPRTWWSRVLAPAHTVTWCAYRNEVPIVSGGRRITGWTETTVAGRRAFVATVPGVKQGRWTFHQLWVNGRRASRTRLPKTGLFHIAALPGAKFEEKPNSHKEMFTGQDRFGYAEGDLQPWRNIEDVEFVGLHYWIDSRIKFQSVDPKTRTARLQWKPKMRLSEDAELKSATYYVENVFEALEDAGQWYLDRPSGKVFYLPRPGERADQLEVIAPVQDAVLRLAGDWTKGKPVEFVQFRDLVFAHNEWHVKDPREKLSIQAAFQVPGAVELRHARECRFDRCRVEHTETYAFELTDGCMDVTLDRCTLSDLGAGGVKIWHTLGAAPKGMTGSAQLPATTCRRITVTDCEIGDGGHRHHQAVGVLIGKCSGNKILHNHIHDFDYTGISVGWTWGYAESAAYGNIIEYNHVHDIGRGVLSDMGGIYLLGVAPGTRVRHNVFHDIWSRTYGGWAIYTDEGSTDVLIENNLAYRTNRQAFHQHYGRDNIVRNNIFAFGGEGQLARSREEGHCSLHFTRNIVLLDEPAGRVAAYAWNEKGLASDHNLYWNFKGKVAFNGNSFAAWRRLGMDAHSRVANPGFRNPRGGDFRLKPNSPALKIGFVPFDLSTVGPRQKEERTR